MTVGPEPYFAMLDYSSYDGSTKQFMLDIENLIVSKIIPLLGDDWVTLVNHNGTYSNDNMGISFQAEAVRASGSIGTSLFNLLLNMLIHEFVVILWII